MYYKFVISFCVILICNTIVAQNYNFSIGATYQPFFYKNFNKTDWNNRPWSYPVEPNNFNGYAIGLLFQKPINDIVSIKSELTYSNQNQKHKILSVLDIQHNHDTVYHYGTDVENEFTMYKLPIQFASSFKIGYASGLYFEVSIGPQISYLTDYTSTYIQYDYNEIDKVIDYDFILNKIVRTPNNSDQTFWRAELTPPMYVKYHNETEFLYSKWLFGAVGEIALKKSIGEFILIGLGGRFEYDFTNSEQYSELTYPLLGGFEDGERTKSHNLRIGLSLTLQYLIY